MISMKLFNIRKNFHNIKSRKKLVKYFHRAGSLWKLTIYSLLFIFLIYLLKFLVLFYSPRICTVNWDTLHDKERTSHIAIITLTDDKINKTQYNRRRHKDIKNLYNITIANKNSYAQLHNYDYINAQEVLNLKRPPGWSKIKAVRKYLPKYDWILWLDIDTVIMNKSIKLESFLPIDNDIDLIVTYDIKGYNSGVWFIRNSDWSMKFLNKWWSLSQFVYDTKKIAIGGDNDAMQFLLDSIKSKNYKEFQKKIKIAYQCAFNSYLWRHTTIKWEKLLRHPIVMSKGIYKDGDFMIHLAGLPNKTSAAKAVLKNASLKEIGIHESSKK